MTDLSVITQSLGHSQRVMAQRSKYVLRHVLQKDPTISYVEYLTNLGNESWTHAPVRTPTRSR